MRAPSFTSRPGFPAGLRVLLLDGGAASRSAAKLLLEQCDYLVTAAATPQAAMEALTAVGSPAFDLLLADAAALGCRTGVIDASASRLLAAANVESVPLLLMGDSPSSNDVLAGIRAGAADFLHRPLNALKLKNIWQHVVRRAMSSSESSELKCSSSSGAADDCIGMLSLPVIEMYSAAFTATGGGSPTSYCEDAATAGFLQLDNSSLCSGRSSMLLEPLELENSGSSHEGAAGSALSHLAQPSLANPSTTPTALKAGITHPWVPAVPLHTVSPPSRPLSRAASSRPASLDRSRGSMELSTDVSAAPARAAGCKRKSKEFSAATSAPAPTLSAPPAGSTPWVWPASSLTMSRTPSPAPSLPPWPGMPHMGHMPPSMALPPGQVWGQPMNPAAVAPGITPPIYNVPAAQPVPALPWNLPTSGFFSGAMCVPLGAMMPAHMGAVMPPHMSGMMQPFMNFGHMGSMMPPPPVQPHGSQLTPAHPTLAIPAAPPAVVPRSVPALVAGAGVTATPLPSPPAAVALPVHLLMSACSIGSAGGGELSSTFDGEPAALLSCRGSSLSSDASLDNDLFIPNMDLGGGKLRKITSTNFLPSLELLLWEDLDEDEDGDLAELGDLTNGTGCDLEGCYSGSNGLECGGDDDAGSVLPLGLKLKKSLSLADLIEMSLVGMAN